MGSKEDRPFKKYRLEIQPRAKQDLVQIHDYISEVKKEPLNAIKVIDEISNAIDKICLNPIGYKECPELKTTEASYRQSICYHYLIIFRIEKTKITVITITSGRRLRSRISEVIKNNP